MSHPWAQLGFRPRWSWAGWRLAWRALRRVVSVRLALWRSPHARVRAAFRRRLQRTEAAAPIRYADRDLARDPAALAWAVGAAARRVPKASCLTQAIALESLLAEAGEEARLRIGVARKPDGAFEAHAWVEHAGLVLIGDLPNLERFSVLPEGTAASGSSVTS